MDQITGTASTHLNGIWYMLMLGSDLGWDYSAFINARPGYNPQNETELSYGNLEYGYSGPSSGCLGNGSLTGDRGANQTLPQRLVVAQRNTRHIPAGDIRALERRFAKLEDLAQCASDDQNTKERLVQPLQRAVTVLNRAFDGRPGGASATTPTLMLEWFIQQVERSGFAQPVAAHLTTEAYSLIAQMEFQK